MRIAKTAALSLACLLHLCASAWATSTDCVKTIFEYGADFDATALEAVIETKRWQTQNRHVPEELIQWTTIRTKGGWATMRECASCSPRIGITELFLSSDRQDLPCGLKNGMTTESLIRRMGQPHDRRGNDLVYLYPPDERNQEITMTVKRGRFAGVRWRFYND